VKRICVCLLALLLCAACTGTLAERTLTARMTDLLDAPDDGAQALMRYYVGVEVEIVREAAAGYVLVNVGELGGSLMGYMKKENLAVGEIASREVRPDMVECFANWQECTLYSAPDTLSEAVRKGFYVEGATVLGYVHDQWMHMKSDYGETGFVSLEELGEVDKEVRQAYTLVVHVMEDELSVEDAVEEAKRILIEDYESGANRNMGMGYPLTREGLDACDVDVRAVRYVGYDHLHYEIDFKDPETQAYYAWIILDVEGMDVLSYSYGNG